MVKAAISLDDVDGFMLRIPVFAPLLLAPLAAGHAITTGSMQVTAPQEKFVGR